MLLIFRFMKLAALVSLGALMSPARGPAAPPQDPLATVHLPAFQIRTMDHQPAGVKINGVELPATPCLWAIHGAIKFDPRLPVIAWPPAGAVFFSSVRRADLEDCQAELYIGQGNRLASAANGLLPNDCVLFVNGVIRGQEVRGALRLRVEGYRWIFYTPLEDADAEHTGEFSRTLWFERTPDE